MSIIQAFKWHFQGKLILFPLNVQFQNISILPPRKGLEIPGGGGGFPKTKKFEEMYELELEFPEGWRALIKNPFRTGGMDILWNHNTEIKLFFMRT